MKLAILGGSFNPVHRGHVALAREVRERLSYDRILIIPALMSPHKNRESYLDPIHRVRMLEIAFGSSPWAEICLCEINRTGPSYTYDTIREIYDTREFTGKPGLVIGDDWTGGFTRWKHAGEIREMTDLIVARRENHGETFPYACTYLDNRIVTVSSTEIREMIKRGQPVESLVPEGIGDYIRENGLYLS